VPNRYENKAYDRFIGVDPGVKGALALMDSTGKILDVRTTPTSVALKQGKTKKGNAKIQTSVDLPALVALLKEWTTGHRCLLVIERVQPMGKGEGSVSLWSFASGFFCFPAIAVALDIPYQLVTATQWKKGMGLSDETIAGTARALGIGVDKAKRMVKEKDRQKAMQLFPAASHYIQNKGDHGGADAMLLAEFVRRTI